MANDNTELAQPTKTISIQGARTHNLANVSVNLPRDRLVLLTGLSGSGKSSLAFDTLYAEGQRRYVESLSAYARQFLSLMEKPEVDHISGLSPAIAIEQKSTSHNPRSTVGTITEIYDYLRLLFARVGEPKCPVHRKALAAQSVSQMVDQVLALPEGSAWMLLAPVVRNRKGEHKQLIESLRGQGYVRMRVDGKVMPIEEVGDLNPQQQHTLEVVVDRFKSRANLKSRLAESFETALRLSGGIAIVDAMTDKVDSQHETYLYSEHWACPECDYSVPTLEPRLFSFNSPVGACPACEGLGVKQVIDPDKVVKDPSLSLAEGAIRGWDRRHFYYFQLLESLAAHYGFALETAFESLAPEVQQAILYGTGQERIKITHTTMRGRSRVRHQAFEGVIPILARRYTDTETDTVREEIEKFMVVHECESCGGGRLNQAAAHVEVAGVTLPEVVSWSIDKALSFFESIALTGNRAEIAERILKEIRDRLAFLMSVGLNYLSLGRRAGSLSGGEAQRIRLASQIGSGLVGVMYVLDEPTIGLHQRDNQRLINTLVQLRDLGNTVIMIEHDEDAIRQADYIVDIGPGAGVHGGRVVAEGPLEQILANPDSLTGQYLSGNLAIDVPAKRLQPDLSKLLEIHHAHCNNLKNVNVAIPLGLMTCVTGVSGSGKSSLINNTLYPEAYRVCSRRSAKTTVTSNLVAGLESLDQVIQIDQRPIGRTPRSNPATYTGIFGPIRELFAGTQEARARGYKAGRFSFNVKGGRCEACHGGGSIKVEMHFLADVYVTCDVCKGQRYQRETLEVTYKNKHIAEVLDLTVEEALIFFEAVPPLVKKLNTLIKVGLGYLALGQSATTLSGGEAQRLKLARELSKRDTGKTLYLLDEPTTGLHFHDVKQLIAILMQLRDHGNTVVIIEHNLDVIKTADWIIDMGPEGGDAGGEVLATGSPEAIVKVKESHTGRYLESLLQKKGKK